MISNLLLREQIRFTRSLPADLLPGRQMKVCPRVGRVKNRSILTSLQHPLWWHLWLTCQWNDWPYLTRGTFVAHLSVE